MTDSDILADKVARSMLAAEGAGESRVHEQAELMKLEALYCAHGDTVHYTEPPYATEYPQLPDILQVRVRSEDTRPRARRATPRGGAQDHPCVPVNVTIINNRWANATRTVHKQQPFQPN